MILEVDGLVVGYSSSVVVHGLSLHVDEAEIVSLIGRNGAGKTTTMRGIMGLTRPRTGSVRLRGRQIAGQAPFEIARLGVGYMPDDRRIFPNLSVEENLLLAAYVTPARRHRWDLQKVYELFPPLRTLRTSRGDHLSGGEQKMLAIGRALMKDPDLLLLDEPAEGLAPLIVKQLIGVLRDVRHTGVTMLLTDQNLTFCRKVADRAYIMEKGTVAAEGPMDTIWQNQELINRYLAL